MTAASVRTGIIAAAGSATRMWPSSKVYPKELLPLGRMPAVAHVVGEMVDAGIEEITIVVRKDDRSIEALLDPKNPPPASVKDDDVVRRFERMIRAVRISYREQDGPYGNGTPLLTARSAARRGPCVYAFADDIVLGENVTSGLIDTFQSTGHTVLAAQPISPEEVSQFGIVECAHADRKSRVTRFLEKPRPGETNSRLASLGRYIVTKELTDVLENTPLGKNGELWLSDAFRSLLHAGSPIDVFQLTQGKWFTVGNPESYASAVQAAWRPRNGGLPIASDSRPWGRWEEYLDAPGYRVKRLILEPGKRISLQKHNGRSEHWVVVSGRGIATIDQRVVDVGPGDSLFVPRQAVHRLANVGATPLVVIETQLGDCDENDIVRIEDDFGR